MISTKTKNQVGLLNSKNSNSMMHNLKVSQIQELKFA
jgi:hypothetical protein